MTTEAQESPIGQRSSVMRRIKNFFESYGRTSYGGNPFVQQTLPSLFSYSAPHFVLPVYALVCIIFCTLGIVLILRGDRYYEVSETYSHINRYQYIPSDPNININQGIRKFVVGNVTHVQGTRTRVNIKITQTLKAPVYLYYTLENFYQNFRDFHDGRSIHQMVGNENPSKNYVECRPFETPGFLDDTGDTPVSVRLDSTTPTMMKYSDFTYNPCGLAPWSMFNDSFVLYRLEGVDPASDVLTLICNTSDFDATGGSLGNSISPNMCRKKGISWDADEKIRFKGLQLKSYLWSLRYPFPNDNPYLTNGWYANEPGHKLTDPADYDLQVWLRSSILSNFRKLFRIIDVDLEMGHYVMDIDEFFDVTTLRGKKGFLLRSESQIGTDGYGIGIAFFLVGCAAFVMGVAFGIEFFCRWRHHGTRLKQPRARWYVFDPNDVEMRFYYNERTKRYEPERKKTPDPSGQ